MKNATSIDGMEESAICCCCLPAALVLHSFGKFVLSVVATSVAVLAAVADVVAHLLSGYCTYLVLTSAAAIVTRLLSWCCSSLLVLVAAAGVVNY
ncbi:hypothetical protein MAM1_0041c02918 [Mucor ambiguus]|uniref:Uncharacterized protein n=1 Tax=Mucor ambiguus TaxID=91626 RepID=A0A0C9LT72_9FUNG|nr:hypothetical protein MAM1_0041c02918 [Mucor ambiguus]